MFTCVRITNIEYYNDESERMGKENADARRDYHAYATDNGAAEDQGRWLALGSGRETLLSMVDADGALDANDFRMLARGFRPGTGEELVAPPKGEDKKRTAGYDLQFAPPKDVSALYAVGSEQQRAHIVRLHREAVGRVLRFAHGEGLIETRVRRGRESVAGCVVASFTHTTSRTGDPQLHDHAVLLNVAVWKDGRTGTLDNATLLEYQGAMGAMYRTELANSLERELGLAVVREKRAFYIDGVPRELCETWSKRREAITEAALANGYTTADNRAGADNLAKDTRNSKEELPSRAELEFRWEGEVSKLGWSPSAIWESARAARSRRDASEAEGFDTVAATTRAAAAAIEALEEKAAVIERRHLLCEVAERMQGVGGADDALAAVERLLSDRQLVQVGEVEGEPMYATLRTIELERQMLRDAIERQEERGFISADEVEAAIDRKNKRAEAEGKPGLSEEQARAVRHALNDDGVAIVQGRAGAGKSYSSGPVADAAREAGLTVWTIAPSWQATDVIRSDTETAEEMARAVQGFINRLNPAHADHIELDRRSVILVDEAGMVGLHDMAPLLAKAREAGAKVALFGDTRQLQPVAAGAPMRALAKAIGSRDIEVIQRQRAEWMRKASEDFSKPGGGERAFEAYDRAGKVIWSEDRQSAMNDLVEAWGDDLVDNPGGPGLLPRLVLASRHRDVHELNVLLRARARAEGVLKGDDVVLQGITRGEHGSKQALPLAVGDRVIFGDTIELGQVVIRNSNAGQVMAIGEGEDPVVTVKLDRGPVAVARWSEYANSPRNAKTKPEERVPFCQHSYAVTVNSAQGATVLRSFIFNGHGLGAQSAYVSWTRHVLDAHMFVDTARIRDRLLSRKQGGTLKLSSRGKADADHDDDKVQLTGDVEHAEIRARVIEETLREESKRNVSDFVEGDLEPWLKAPFKVVDPDDQVVKPAIAAKAAATRPTMPESLPAHLRPGARPFGPPPGMRRPAAAASSAPSAPNSPTVSASPPVAVMAAPAQPPAAALKQRMEERKAAPVAYPPPRVVRDGQSSDEQAELDAFARMDFKRYLESRGWTVQLVTKDGKTREAAWGGNPPNQWTMVNGGYTINISSPSGTKGMGAGKWWAWTTGSGGKQGTIVKFCKEIERIGNVGQIRKHLRAYAGTDDRKPIQRAATPAGAALEARLREAPPAKVYDFAGMRQRWDRMSSLPNKWLMEARGLARDVLEKFRVDIKTEGGTRNPHAGAACFAHRDELGTVIGYERKFRKEHPLDARSWSMFTRTPKVGITRMGERDAPERIYVGESAIDLLSVYQHDGKPAKALLCSLYGGASRQAYDEVAKLAAKHPQAEIHLCFDNDTAKAIINPHTRAIELREAAGDVFASKTTAAIHERAPEARIVRRPPPEEYKDWNDVIRGQTRVMGERAYAETLARFSGPDAKPADRERAQERIEKDQLEQAVRRIYEARQAGTMTPDQEKAAIDRLLAPREQKGAAELAEQKARDEAAKRAAEEAKKAAEEAARQQQGAGRAR